MSYPTPDSSTAPRTIPYLVIGLHRIAPPVFDVPLQGCSWQYACLLCVETLKLYEENMNDGRLSQIARYRGAAGREGRVDTGSVTLLTQEIDPLQCLPASGAARANAPVQDHFSKSSRTPYSRQNEVPGNANKEDSLQ
eukprot:1156858-Pelagomonas_calceolata.AAC.6